MCVSVSSAQSLQLQHLIPMAQWKGWFPKALNLYRSESIKKAFKTAG